MQQRGLLVTGTRRLGQTNIGISSLGLGTWQFSEGRSLAGLMWSALPDGEVDAIVATALREGITWFDTAEHYGKGRAERALSRSLQVAGKKDGELMVATKWWPAFRSARSIRRTFPERVQSLSPFSVGLHQIHWPWSLSSLSLQMKEMAGLVAEGKVQAVGVSNFSAAQMRSAHSMLASYDIPLASNQVKYSLLDRRIEANGVLDAAKELNITIIAYSPLDMGLLSGKFHADPDLLRSRPRMRRAQLRRQLAKSRDLVEALQRIASVRGMTTTQVALHWLVNFHGDTVVAIPGATKPEHVSQNAVAMRISLTPEEMREIHELSRVENSENGEKAEE